MPTPKYHSPSGKGNRNIDITFEPGEFSPVTPYSEDLKDEYQEAKHALHELRQREEQIRRKAEQLEEITEKEEAFSEGRGEMIDQIEEYLDLLEYEGSEAQRLAQECAGAHQRLHHHLNIIQKLRPEAIDRSDLNVELDLALRHIEAAEIEVSNSQPLIEKVTNSKRTPSISPKNPSGNPDAEGDFSYWLRAGFAFTLPLMMLVIAMTIAFLYLK